MKAKTRTVVATIAVTLLAGACGGGGNDMEEMPGDTASDSVFGSRSSPESEAVQQAGISAELSPAAVEVTLNEFDIEAPRTLPAGPATFRVTNEGSMPHSFRIRGQGVEAQFDSNLKPGQSRTLEAELEPGTYGVMCPVEDHADRGMQFDLRVTKEDSATSAVSSS